MNPGMEATGAPSPDSERYESLARDLVLAYETGNAAAIQRVQEYAGRSSLAWEELRAGVRQRLDAIPDAEKPGGYFAVPHAQLFIARLRLQLHASAPPRRPRRARGRRPLPPVAHGAADPKYVTYPYNETLVTVAEDRGLRCDRPGCSSSYLSRPDLP